MNAPPAATIAVASGKGGTGKTTVAAHLSLAAARSQGTLLLDLDVEAPDALGYFPGAVEAKPVEAATVMVPRLEKSACAGCGLCAKSCRFGAIIAIGGVVTIDTRICKGCGRCVMACPEKALTEVSLKVGSISAYRSNSLAIMEGRMAIGDLRATTVIEAAKHRACDTGISVQIRDCPPGVSCPASHAIEGADYAILVAEPTEFSMHDLGAAVELVQGRKIPVGVIINKDGFGLADIDGFCSARRIPIIGRIAFSRERAASGASGRLWDNDIRFMKQMERVLEIALGHACNIKVGRS